MLALPLAAALQFLPAAPAGAQAACDSRKIRDVQVRQCYDDLARKTGVAASDCATAGEVLADRMSVQFPALAVPMKTPELADPGYAYTYDGCLISRQIELLKRGGGHTRPNGAGIGTAHRHGRANKGGLAGAFKTIQNNGIFYHGGPVMQEPATVYYIWYGEWTDNTAVPLLSNLVQHLGPSPYFNINSTYAFGSRRPTNRLRLGGGVSDKYSRGARLRESDVFSIVSSAVGSGALPADPNAIYMVLTSSDVGMENFCSSYCGWHSARPLDGRATLKFSWIGDPGLQCPRSCGAQDVGPNENQGADSMASVIAHEISETVTDPELNAWFDQRGQENADLCAWQFGPTRTAPNGAAYNVALGGVPYLLQQNWVNADGGYCDIVAPPPVRPRGPRSVAEE